MLLACPSCNNKKDIRLIYTRLNKAGDLLRCYECGLYFMWPRPNFIEDNEIYTKEYYDAWSLSELGDDGLAKIKLATAESVLNAVSKYKREGSLLEVGCAFGYLLKAAGDRGWDSYGVEISEYAASKTKELVGKERIATGNFMDVSLPQQKFDVIVMVDIIEHIYDISAVFKKCKALLRDNGFLVIVTPDVDSFSRRTFGRFWTQFNGQHYSYLSSSSAERILNRNGFRMLEKTNFKKALNLYYAMGIIRAYCGRFLTTLAEIANRITPDFLKRKPFFMPQGEMLLIAQKM